MPIKLVSRQVEQAKLPGVRLNQRVTPQDITGGFDKALDTTAALVAQQAAKARDDARSARLMDAYSELGNARLDIQSTVERDYQGKAALQEPDGKGLDLAGETERMLKQRADAIAEKLPDEDMRLGFRQHYLREAEGLRGAVTGHVLKQGEKAAEDAYKNTVTTATNKAIVAGGQGRDALAAQEELTGAAAARAAALGIDPAAETRRVITGMHAGVVERLQKTDRAAEADAYLTLKAPEMDAQVVTDLRKAVAPAALVAQAEAAVKRIEAAHPSDPKARAKAVLDLEGPVGEKARQVFREREAVIEEAAGDAQKASLGGVFDAIEKGAIKTESQLEKHVDFGKLDADGTFRARAYLRQTQQAERTVRASERQAIAATDDSMHKDFDARPLQERAQLDLRGEYGGRVSTDGFNVLRKKQEAAKRDWDKDRGVSATEYEKIVETESQGLPWIKDKGDLASLQAYMGRQRTRWMDEHDGKEPTRAEVATWLAEALTVVDLPYRSDKPAYQTGGVKGRGPAAEQPYLNRPGRMTGAPPAPPARPAAPTPNPADGIPDLLRRPAPAPGAPPPPKKATVADIPREERALIEASMRAKGKTVTDAEVMRRYLRVHPEAN